MGGIATRPWGAWLIGGAGCAVVVSVAPDGRLRDLLVAGVVVSSMVAMIVGVRLSAPSVPTAWYLAAAGFSSSAIGQVIGLWTRHAGGTVTFPALADAFYLASYPLLCLALYALATEGRRRIDPGVTLDVLIVATATGLILWDLFIFPTWTAPVGTLAARLVALAYVVGDVLLVSQVLRVRRTVQLRTASVRLLVAGGLAFLLADLSFSAAPYFSWPGPTVRTLDFAWLVGRVLLAAAALHPSMAQVRVSPGPADRPVPYGRVALVGAMILALPLASAIAGLFGVDLQLGRVAAFRILLLVLVALRAGGLLRRMRDQSVRLSRLAATDFLTGVDNNHRFTLRVVEAIDAAGQRDDVRPVVLFIGIERFSELNNTLGHGTGDALLRAVAARLVHAAPEGSTVARLGGDVFGMQLLLERSKAVSASAVAVRDLFLEPFQLDDLQLTVDGNVGYVVAEPADRHSDRQSDRRDDRRSDGGGGADDGGVAELLRKADLALSAARVQTGRVAGYSVPMDREELLAPVLMSELPHALETDEVVVHYQPQVDVVSGRVSGVEALVRWQHPVHGLLPPSDFVPAAESTGLIRQLTLHVLDRSLAQSARWRRAGLPLGVSVNLSVRDLLDLRLADDVRAALDRHGVEAQDLELEITETMAMADPAGAVAVLSALDAHGVRLAVDDYGTGHSSLAYLQQLPVLRLKIDQSFVADVLRDAASAVIVRSTIDLARNLGLDVVAEGVEDDETLAVLAQMECHTVQGFGIGHPVPAGEIPALVAAIESQWSRRQVSRLPAKRGEWDDRRREATSDDVLA